MDSMEPDYWYTGLHSFLFIDHVAPDKKIREVVGELRKRGPEPEKGPVMFASEFVGPYLAFAHLRTEGEEDLAALQDAIAVPLWDLGVHCKYATETAVASTPTQGAKGAKRGSPGIIGLLQIVVKRRAFDAVMEELTALIDEQPQVYRGASVVFGDFDILFQVGGETLTEAKEAAFALRSIKGILRSQTAFTDGSLYERG